MIYFVLYVLVSILLGIATERYALSRPFDSEADRIFHAMFFAVVWPFALVLVVSLVIASLIVGDRR